MSGTMVDRRAVVGVRCVNEFPFGLSRLGSRGAFIGGRGLALLPGAMEIMDHLSIQAAEAAGLKPGVGKDELIVIGSNCLKSGIEMIKAGKQHSTGTQIPTRTGIRSAEAIAEFESKEKDGIEVKATLAGRIRATRAMGKISFAHIEDGAGKVQLFFRMNEVGKERLEFFNKMFDIGDFIQAEGVMFRTKTGEITLHVHDFCLLAKSVSPLPAAKDETLEDGTVVRHAALEDPELRARQRYADLAVNPDVRDIFRKRAGIIKALREFLDDKGFLEVETPILQPLYGGAAARPFVTHHNELEQEMYLRDVLLYVG